LLKQKAIILNPVGYLEVQSPISRIGILFSARTSDDFSDHYESMVNIQLSSFSQPLEATSLQAK